MLGLDGGIEILIVLGIVVALLFLVPKKLPDLMRGLGRSIGEFKKARTEIEQEIREGK